MEIFQKNHYIIEVAQGKFFQSYNDTIAFIPNYTGFRKGVIVDVKKMGVSDITQKSTEHFLDMTLEEVVRQVADGEILDRELN